MKHEVITSVCFTEKEKQTIISESTFVLFKKLSISEINYYLNNFDFLDKAGAYGIQDWIGNIGVKESKEAIRMWLDFQFVKL